MQARASKPARVTASNLMYNILSSCACVNVRMYFTITIASPEILLHLPSGQCAILHCLPGLLFLLAPPLPAPAL